MKRVIITFLCLLCIVQAYSQSFTISGTIIDGESNEPLIGAGILVKGAGRGTITDIDGKYSLEVKRGETLVFSFVGYQNQEVAITNQRTLNIALRVSEANNLNEVVITGRGSAKPLMRYSVCADLLLRLPDFDSPQTKIPMFRHVSLPANIFHLYW